MKEKVYNQRSLETGGQHHGEDSTSIEEAPALVRRQREQKENMGKSHCCDLNRKKQKRQGKQA